MKTKILSIFFSLICLFSFTFIAKAEKATEINFITHSVFWPLVGKGELLDEFTKKTGIKVNFISMGHKELADKVLLEWMAGTGTYDVIGWSGSRFIRDYTKFMEPLNDFIKKASPEWDFTDLIPAVLKLHTFDDVIYGITIRTGLDILFYRKDLFNKYGLKVPKTWDEYLTVAKALTLDTDGDGKTDIYGSVFYGDPVYATDTASDFIHSFGGKFVEEVAPGKWKAVINSPVSQEALQFMADLYRKHKVTPLGLSTMNNADVITALQQGIAAMSTMYAPYFGSIEDPTKSKVVGKIGYAPLPAKAGLRFPGVGWTSTWAICIDKKSKKKEAAWKFVEFFTSKRADLYMAVRGNLPSRFSAFESPDFLKQVPTGFNEAVSKQMASNVGKYTISAAPAEWAEFCGTAFNSVLVGVKTSKQALEELETKINESLKEFKP